MRESACAFCRRPVQGVYAVTACRGDADDPRSWGRGTLGLCRACHAALRGAGEAGRVLKGIGQWWWLGDAVGRLPANN